MFSSAALPAGSARRAHHGHHGGQVVEGVEAAGRAARPLALTAHWRQLGQLALERRDVGFLARDGGLHLGHAVQVALVVALVAAALGLAVVVLLLQFGQALFFARSSVARMRRASLSRALHAGSTGLRRGAAVAGTVAARPGLRAARRLHHRDRRALDGAAALARAPPWR
jgi:hypothetical protein